MPSRRMFLRSCAVALASTCTSSAGLYSALAALSAARANPAAVIAAAATAISVIRMFSESSDGGVSAMLTANLRRLQIISSQIETVIQQLADVQVRLSRIRKDADDSNQLDRLIGYYDDITGASRQFRETYAVEAEGRVSRDASLEAYGRIAERVYVTRTKMQSYGSLVPAIAAPLSLGVEIAARRRANQAEYVRPALAGYLEWVEGMLNDEMPESISHTIKHELLPEHERLMRQCGAMFAEGSNVCNAPKEGRTFEALMDDMLDLVKFSHGDPHIGSLEELRKDARAEVLKKGAFFGTCLTVRAPVFVTIASKTITRQTELPRRVRFQSIVTVENKAELRAIEASLVAPSVDRASDPGCAFLDLTDQLDVVVLFSDVKVPEIKITAAVDDSIRAAALAHPAVEALADKLNDELQATVEQIMGVRQQLLAHASAVEIAYNLRAKLVRMAEEYS